MTRLTRPLIRPLTRSIMLGLSDRGISFYVGYLFANGQQGAWYDQSDFSTLFQNAAGSIPVTAVEQPVGLVLDKRLGLVRGIELVVNGDFTSAAGWTAGGGWAIASGAASATASGTLSRAITVTAGVSYEITYTVVSRTAGQVMPNFSGGTTVNGATESTVGNKRCVVTAGVGNSTLGFVASGSPVLSIDNVSVRELPGNHATQATAAARPVLSADGLLRFDRFDGVDDSLTSTTGGGASPAAFLCIGFRQLTNGASNVLWSDRTGNTGLKLEVTAGGLIAFSGGNGAAIITATGGAVALNTDYVVTALYDGVNLSVQLNNAAATTAACVLSAGTAGFTIGKDNGAASGFANVRIYQTVYVKDGMPTPEQIIDTKRFVAGKSGVTL